MSTASAETLLLLVDPVMLLGLQPGDVTPGQGSALFCQVLKRLFAWRDYIKLQLSQSIKLLTSTGDKRQKLKNFY